MKDRGRWKYTTEIEKEIRGRHLWARVIFREGTEEKQTKKNHEKNEDKMCIQRWKKEWEWENRVKWYRWSTEIIRR